MEGPFDWQPIPIPEPEEGELRFAAYWVQIDTDDPDFDPFIKQPLRFYKTAFDQVDEGWRVVTAIFGHERGLNPRIVYATATVSEEDQTVYATHYKYDPEKDLPKASTA